MKFPFTAVLLAGSVLCLGAQEPQQPPQKPEQPQPIESEQAQPLDVRDIREPIDAPVERPAEEAGPAYRGPTIVSRGGQASVLRGRDMLLDVRPYLGLEAVYDTQLTTVTVDPNGRLPQVDAFGGALTFGASGTHFWRRTVLDVDYGGELRHYTKDTFFDGLDQRLMLGVSHQVSRRWEVAFSEAGATFTRLFFLPLGIQQQYDPTFFMLTADQLFDNRTYALFSNGQAVYNATGRLSFGFGGSGFFVRHRSSALAGVNGYTAAGNVAYRLGRFSTIGVDYNFTRYEFQQAFGDSALHGVGIDFSHRFGRRWELGLRVGGYRVETTRLVTVQLDPALARLFGFDTFSQAFHGTTYQPHFSGHLTRGFRRTMLSFSYIRTVSPGNGVYLTSTAEAITGILGYTASRRISLSLDGGTSRYRAVTQSIGNYRSYNGGLGMGIRLFSTVSWTMGAQARTYQINTNNVTRVLYTASAGLVWSPGEYPVSIW